MTKEIQENKVRLRQQENKISKESKGLLGHRVCKDRGVSREELAQRETGENKAQKASRDCKAQEESRG